MSEIGASEAKTHLPRLLKRVQAGERFVITRHNRPVAELTPFRTHDASKIRAAIDDLKAFQNSSFGIQNDGKSLHFRHHLNSSRMVKTSGSSAEFVGRK